MKLEELGYKFDEKDLNLFFKKFKDLADRKKQVFEEDLYALIDSEKKFSEDKLYRAH